MAKNAKRLNLETTTAPAPAPVFDPNVPDVGIMRRFRDYYATIATTAGDTGLTTQRGDLVLWNDYAMIRQQYPTAGETEWFKSLATRIFDGDNTETQVELPTNFKLSKAAQSVVDVLNQDQTFIDLTGEAITARAILQAVELQFLTRLLTDFATVGNEPWVLGKRGAFVCPMLDTLPEPGSKEPSKKERKEGKHGYDGKGNALSERPAHGYDLAWHHVDGKDKLVSCYREMACTFPQGIAIVEDIRACAEGQKGKYKGNSKEYIEGHEKRLKGHLSDIVGWLRFAVSAIRQMQAVNAMSKLHCYLITSEQVLAVEGSEPQTVIQIVPGTTVMWIEETRDGGNRQGCTLQEFMTWRPTVAEEKGGTIAELTSSEPPAETREPNSGQGNVTAKIESVTAINYAMVSEMFSKFLTDNITVIQRDMNHPDHTKSDAALFALANIYISLEAMFDSHPDYVVRADKGLAHAGKFIASFGHAAPQPIVEKMQAAGNPALGNANKPRLSI